MQPASEVIAAQYKLEQTARAAALQAYVAFQFTETVRPDAFGMTVFEFVDKVLPTVMRERGAAAGRARTVATAIRRLEVPSTPRLWKPVEVDVLTDSATEAARTSLRVVGGAKLFKHIQTVAKAAGFSDEDYTGLQLLDAVGEETWLKARDSFAQQVGGAAARHGQNGGRETMATIARNDSLATGWGRVTRDDCCHLCALLGTRGFVYDKYSFEASNARFTGTGSQKVHDNCHCELVPTYDPPGQRKFTDKQNEDWDLYQRLTPGGDQMLKFRRAYEGRAEPGDLSD